MPIDDERRYRDEARELFCRTLRVWRARRRFPTDGDRKRNAIGGGVVEGMTKVRLPTGDDLQFGRRSSVRFDQLLAYRRYLDRLLQLWNVKIVTSKHMLYAITCCR